jgi:hypothetical protein
VDIVHELSMNLVSHLSDDTLNGRCCLGGGGRQSPGTAEHT